MSATASLGDGSFDPYYTYMFRIAAVGLFVAFYLSAMKMCFGTYYLRSAFTNYKANKVIRKRYYELFASRDNLLYHISWSKTRGELEEAKNLMKQLENVDKVIGPVSLLVYLFVLFISLTTFIVDV